MQPRRKQPSLTIRSARAIERLKLLTRDGRSQAAVIEEALERMPLPPQERLSLDERRARIMDILERIDASRIPSMAEFDAREYDERGNPR
jgi:hypothetical protein